MTLKLNRHVWTEEERKQLRKERVQKAARIQKADEISSEVVWSIFGIIGVEKKEKKIKK